MENPPNLKGALSHTDTLSLLSSEVENEMQVIYGYLQKMIANTTQKKEFTIVQLREKQKELEDILNQEKSSLTKIMNVISNINPEAMAAEASFLENLRKRKISIRKLQDFLTNISSQIEELQNQYVIAIQELEQEQQIVRKTLEDHMSSVKKGSVEMTKEVILEALADEEATEEKPDKLKRESTKSPSTSPVPSHTSQVPSRTLQPPSRTSLQIKIDESEPQPEEQPTAPMTTDTTIIEQRKKSEIEQKSSVKKIISKVPSVSKPIEKLKKQESLLIGSVQKDIKNFYETTTEDKLDEHGCTLSINGNIKAENGNTYTVPEAIHRGLLKGIEVETAKFAFIDYLASRGLHLTPSCNLMNTDGYVITIEEARMNGYLNDLDDEIEKLIFPDLLALRQVEVKKKISEESDDVHIQVVTPQRKMSLKEANEAQIFQGLMYDTAHYILSVFLAEKDLVISSPSQLINLRSLEGGNLTLEEAKEKGLLEGLDPEIYQMIFNVMITQTGLTIRPDGNLETKSGKAFTVEEAKILGLLDGIVLPQEAQEKLDCILRQYGILTNEQGLLETNVGVVSLKEARLVGILRDISNEIVQRHVDIELSSKNSITKSASTTDLSLSSLEESENSIYLKGVVGIPLAKCLAQVTATKPSDPIHYIAQWLYNYRIQEENDIIRKQELQELMEERLKLQKIEVADEAKRIVMKMMYKAQIDAELSRIAKMQQEAEGYLDENMTDYKGQLQEMEILL